MDRIGGTLFRWTLGLMFVVVLLFAANPPKFVSDLFQNRIEWNGISISLREGESPDYPSAGLVKTLLAHAYGSPTIIDLLGEADIERCLIITDYSSEALLCPTDLSNIADNSPLTLEEDQDLYDYASRISEIALDTNQVVVEELPSVRENLLSSGLSVMSYLREFRIAALSTYGVSLERSGEPSPFKVEIRAIGIGPSGGVAIWAHAPSRDQLERFFAGRE